jgi:hypothetical protein
MTDGPIHRDIDDPSAALVHLHVEDLGRAMLWFGTAACEEASAKSTAAGRDIYVATRYQPG